MYNILIKILNKDTLKYLIIFIVLDVIFGILRSIKEKTFNSTIGIDGIIRKVGMIITIVFCLILDEMMNINLINFIPASLIEILPVKQVGIASFFNILYVLCEIVSILKNMYRCKLPVPKKLQELLKRILKDFTSEINNDK